MTSKAYDFEKGLSIKTEPLTEEEKKIQRGWQETAEREQKAALREGYMRAYLAPSIALAVPWATKAFASLPLPTGNLEAWIPRWLVYSYRAALAAKREKDVQGWLRFHDPLPGCERDAVIGLRDQFEKEGLYREAE